MADLTDSHCWAPDNAQVFKVVKIRDREGADILVSDIDPSSGLPLSAVYAVPQSSTFQIFAIEELHAPPGDLIQLTDVHRAGILHALRHRFEKDLIYTSVGPILVALNPFKWIEGIYNDSVKERYANGDLNLSENPHVFAMAHDSHVGLQLGKNQSLIISGESGAGKTEATKQCLSYLASAAGSSTGLQTKILQASPILEAWGNAKTLRNNNSSRFGKFIEIWFSDNYDIAGSSNTTYLLEKSRVVFQEEGERNYHIFYQLLFGAPAELRTELQLDAMAQDASAVSYINQSGCIQIEGVSESDEYSEMTNAMKAMGFSELEEKTLYRAIAGILHLGNLSFQPDATNSEACQFTESGAEFHSVASLLFGLDPHFFRSALLYKAVKSGKRSSVVYSNYTANVAEENRNALSKELYNRCFNWIVAKVNSVLNVTGGPSSGGMIGILDIFGFEIFKRNSFEQLCINLANEALQQHFNINIFQHEMEIYESEGIVIPDLSYNDNQDVLDLIMKKPKGLIPMLDEEGQVPRGSTDGFISKFTKAQATNVRLKYRAGQKDFTVVHYAGEVKYDPALFMTKNKDTLSQDLLDIFSGSSVELFAELFAEAPEAPAATPGTPSAERGKRMSSMAGGGGGSNKLTVGHRFRLQLDSLISNLNSTEPRYIRCIKPNQVKKPNIFEAYLTNEQLTYSGVFEAVVIMQNGYPFRLSHVDFKHRYHMLALTCRKWKLVFASKDNKQMCVDLTKIVAENLYDSIENCHVGKTMVFYRSEQHRFLEKERKRTMSEALALLLRSIRGGQIRHLVGGIRTSAANCEAAIDDADMVSLKEMKDFLNDYCERFLAISGVALYEDLRSLSDRYYDVAELQKEAEASLLALLERKDDFEDGLLSLFDQIEAEYKKALTINFNENFNGRNIVIVWSDNKVFIEAQEELEGMRIIKNVKSNLSIGVENKDEILLKEWIQRLAEYRSTGQVTPDFCRAEEAEAKAVVEAAQRQYDDFIGSTFTAIKEGRFQCVMSDLYDDMERTVDITFTIDAKPIHTFVERNKKLAYSSTSMQIKQVLILCENLYGLRNLLGSGQSGNNADWTKLWELLQRWKRYFCRPEDVSGGGGFGRSDSIFRQDSMPRVGGILYRSASMIRSSSVIMSGGMNRRASTADDPAAQEALLIPHLPDLAVEVSEEIYSMVKCCLEAVYFRQLHQEVMSNRIPSALCFENVRLPLSAMDHTLKVLGGHSHILSMNQVNRFTDAKERWMLRRGVCGRSAEVLNTALSGGAKLKMPSGDPEFHAAQQFCNLYTCEKEFLEALEHDAASGHAGHINFADIQPQRLSNTLINAENITVQEPKLARVASAITKQGQLSGWKLLLRSCTEVNNVRRTLQSGDLSGALTLIEAVLREDPWRMISLSQRPQEVIDADNAKTAQDFLSAVDLAQSVAPSIVTNVSAYLLHKDTMQLQVESEGSGNQAAETSGVDSGPDMVATHLVTRELMRYRAEINHIQEMNMVKDALAIGALTGEVGELDIAKVSELHLLTAIERAATQSNLIPTIDSFSLLKCAAGISKMRTMARNGEWQGILTYLNSLFSSGAKISAGGSSRRSFLHSSPSEDSVEELAASFGSVVKKLHPWCQDEYKVFFSEVMDLQTRNKLLDAFSSGKVTVNEETGDLNCFFASTDKLGDAIQFADQRSEKSIECQYLYSSAKLLFCLRFQVMASRWENMHISSDFPASLLLNFPTENVMVEVRDELVSLKKNLGSNEMFKLAVKTRVEHLLATADYFVSGEQYEQPDGKSMLYDPMKADMLLQNPIDFLKRYLGNTVSSSRRKSIAASQLSMNSGVRTGSVVAGTIAPNLAVADLLVHASYCGYHEEVAEEIECISNAFRERNCRLCLVLASSIDCVRGTVDTLDSTTIEINLLTRCIENSKFYLETRAASPLMHAYYDAAFQLLNIRLAVDGAAEGVDLLTYFTSDQLDIALGSLENTEFPRQEINLVVDHIRDSNSIAALVDAIHLGRPQFYTGKFDTKNVSYEHLLTYLEIAKKLIKRSDRLDRLMFYAELCVLLRKALMNHQWDISEMGERSSEPKSRGITVKQCLDDYGQAGNFFQRRMVGIPPRALVDEFQLAQREWDRRLILQGFPTALQSGQLANVPGSVELREVKYARLQQQIERAQQWINDTGVKDPDLDMLVRAGNEIVETRKALISVHLSYRRSFDPVVRSRSETILNINSNRNITDGGRSLEKIVQSLTFLGDSINDALTRVSQLLVRPYTFVTEWRDVESCVAKMETSGRLRSTRLQVELLAAETFERSFTAGLLDVFHNLDSKEGYVSMDAKNQVVIKSLAALCKSHMLRGSEMAKMGSSSLRFSSTLEMLYNSAVILMNLYMAESSKQYDELARDWKSPVYLAQMGTIVTPGIHLLQQSVFGPFDYSVQAVLRSTMAMRCRLHPRVSRQVARACRHVEDEITLLELSNALHDGAVRGRVGGVDTESISITSLEAALHRAHETSEADESHPSLLLSLIETAGGVDVSWRAPCRLKYNPRFSITEVAIIDMTVGWGSGLASQMYTEKWGSAKRHNLSQTAAAAKVASAMDKVGKQSKWGLLKAHLKAGNIVPQFKYLDEECIQEALTSPVFNSMSLINTRRPDVIQLRNSCEMICELRHSMRVKDYEAAFEILNENLGRSGYSFTDMFRVIYEAEFSIHPLAMEEFTLISLEVCESYWRVLAREALSVGVATGKRGRINIVGISWSKLDDILQLLDGLLEISRESIILRELCYMVRYMRCNSICGGNSTLRAFCRDEPIWGKQDPKNKRAPLLDLTKDDATNATFVEDAIVNALTMVGTISLQTDQPEGPRSVKEAQVAYTAACRVFECLGVIDESNLPSALRLKLRGESCLLEAHYKFLLTGYALEKAYAMEGLWFSYTSSALEISSEVLRLLDSAVEDALKLKLDASHSAESRWALMLASAVDLLAVMRGCLPFPEGPSVFNTCKPTDQSPLRSRALESLHRLMNYYKYCNLLAPPAVMKKYDTALTSALSENDRVTYLLEIIAGTRQPVPADGFDSAFGELIDPDSKTPSSDDPSEMASFRGSVIWRVAMLHAKLRQALSVKDWGSVQALARAIVAADMFNVRNKEVAHALTLCRCLKIQRNLQKGITDCILPPFPGWSSFSNYRAIICKISDYSLRQAIEDCEQYMMESCNNDCFSDFPAIPELLGMALALADLVSALRGSRWTADARGTAAIARRSSIGTSHSYVIRSSKSLYLQDGAILADDNNDSGAGVEFATMTEDPVVSLEEITENLDNEFQTEVNAFRSYRSAEQAVEALKEKLLTATCIDSSCGLGKFLDHTINTVSTELQFINLDDSVKMAIEECIIKGVPGKLSVDVRSITYLKTFCDSLVPDKVQDGSATKEFTLMTRCARLRRGYLSARLLLRALCLISSNAADGLNNITEDGSHTDWVELYRVLHFYRHMASLEWNDPEIECDALMIAPDIATGVSIPEVAQDILRMSEEDFINVVEARTDVLKNASVLSTSGKISAGLTINAQDQDSLTLSSIANELFGCTLNELLRATEDVAPFMQLLDQHCAFKVAEDIFQKELDLHFAAGRPGELDTNGVDPKPLQVVMQILFDSGLLLQDMPGQYLYNAAKALSGLRISQQNAGPLLGDPAGDERSLAFFDTLNSALAYASEVISAEEDHNKQNVDSPMCYLLGASTEIQTAWLDVKQRDFARRVYDAITSNRITLDGEENHLSLGESVVSKIIAPVDVSKLASLIAECSAFEKESMCPVVSEMFDAACKLNEIRITCMSRNWTDILDTFKIERELSVGSVSIQEIPHWKLSFQEELMSSQRLAVVSLAVEASDYALMVGRISATPLGSVQPSRLNCTVVTRALDALTKVPNDWRCQTTRSYIFTMELIQQVRCHAQDGNWNVVHDICRMALHPDRLALKPLTPAGMDEIKAALQQSAYFLSENYLLQALSSQWRMRGDVGAVDCSCISAAVLRHAIHAVEDMGVAENDYILNLITSARIIFDLRRAQLYGLWVAPSNPAASFNVSVIEENLLGICIPMAQPKDSDDTMLRDNGSENAAVSKSFISLSNSGVFGIVNDESKIPEVPALVRWLMRHSDIDQDFAILPEQEEILSVEEVLQGAEYVAGVMGLAEHTQEELDFAREELCYRVVTITLLHALSTPGCTGCPGALNVFSPDEPADEGVPSVSHAIEVAERNIDISSQSHCKWLLRDAKLLRRLRSCRLGRDWSGVREVLLEALDQNDVEALNEAHDPRVSMISDGVRDRSNQLVHQPIIAPVWTEIMIMRADFNFYACLADFAQEISNGARRADMDVDTRDKRPLTAILHILLRTRAASLMWPNSDEFNRLIETEQVALELRAQRIFDSGHFPSTNVITKVNIIRARDSANGLISYSDLLVPEIELLSDMLNIQQLIDAMENALNVGQGYLRCPIGHISRQEMELDVLGDAVKACLLQKLDTNGTIEQIKLVKLGNVMYNVRMSAADGKWDCVDELIEINNHVLRGRMSISEELARLNIEALNFEACTILRTALSSDRFTNVLELVKRISKHKMMGPQLEGLALASVSHGSFESDTVGVFAPTRNLNVFSGDLMRSSSEDQQWLSHRSSITKRSSFHESSWKSFSEELVPHDNTDGQPSNRVDKLENAINLAMAVHHKSDITTSLLKAAVLIRSLRTAISAGYWDEVQQIVSEESNYRNTKVPAETLEEIRVAKAALHYRNCMIALSKGLIVGKATGSPGNMNLSSIECIMLQSAISQAEVLEIDADPGALAMLDIARCVCALRQAIMAARWFTKTDQPLTQSMSVVIADPPNNSIGLGSPTKIISSVDFASPDMELNRVSSPDPFSPEDNQRSASVLTTQSESEDVHGFGISAGSTLLFGLRKSASVEEIIVILKAKLATLPDDWDDDSASESVGRARKESLADISQEDTLATDNSLDWIALQARAVRSAKYEVNLLDENLKERRRQEYIVGALENIPPAVQIFRTGGNNGRPPAGARGLDGMTYPTSSILPGNDSRSTPSSSKDLYLARPLEMALEAARAIPGIISDDTAKLIRTAELILSFRQAMNDLEIENFKKLIESARVMTEKQLISGHYGVFELSTYRSATMTVSLSKAELMKAIRSGTVRGHINSPFYDAIEVEPLHYWVEAHEASAKDMTIALKHALVEAKILTELRRRFKAKDWAGVKKIIEEEHEDIKNLQYAKEEVDFIILACRYQLDIAAFIEGISSCQIPKSIEEQFSYVTVRMADMHRGGRTANSVIDYITDKNLVDSKVLKKLQLKNASPDKEMSSVVILADDVQDITVEIIASDAHNKALEEGHYQLVIECYAIKRLLKLWSAIAIRQWQMEPIAAGMVHAFSIPEDPFLATFMHSLRQHEVGQRLASVHSQLQSLKLKDNKKVKNIKHSVRASSAFVLRPRMSRLDNITEKVEPVPPSAAVLRTLKQRSQHFFVQPNVKTAPQKLETSPLAGPNTSVINNRKASLYRPSVASVANESAAVETSEIMSDAESVSVLELCPAGKPTLAPTLAPLVRSKANRRSSLGAVAQDMNIVPAEKLLMDAIAKVGPAFDIAVSKRRLSIGSVAEQIGAERGAGHSAAIVDQKSSVASILCSQDWTADPDYCSFQFDTARNTLIDQVVQMRLMWGCMEGSVEEDTDGNIQTDSINTDLLTVALSDVRKVEFYTHKGQSDFSFSKHTRSIIHCANGILHCRDAAAKEKYDDLMSELRRLKYVVDKHSSRRMNLPELCPAPGSEIEFDRLVRLACQQHDLSRFSDAVNLLWTRSSVDVTLLRHPLVVALGEREITGISPVSVVTPIHALILLLGMSMKSALVACHNGNTERVHYEEDICVSLLSDPQWDKGNLSDINFEALASIFKMLGGYKLRMCGFDDGGRQSTRTPLRAAPRVPIPPKAETSMFAFHPSDVVIPESETRSDIDKINKIFVALLQCVEKVAYNNPLHVPSDLIEELKFIMRRVEGTLASASSRSLVDPWVVLAGNLLLMCARPAYTTDATGRYMHKLPYAVCGFLRDGCGTAGLGGRISDINASAYINCGQALAVIPSVDKFIASFDVSNVSTFIRTLVSNEAYNVKVAWDPDAKNKTPVFRTDKVNTVSEDPTTSSGFIFAGDGGKTVDISSSKEAERCVKKVRSLFLSNARLLANAMQIEENNSTGLAKVAMIDIVEMNDRSKIADRVGIKERLFSRFGRQCDAILRSIDDIHGSVTGNKDATRSKQVRTAIYRRRKQLKN